MRLRARSMLGVLQVSWPLSVATCGRLALANWRQPWHPSCPTYLTFSPMTEDIPQPPNFSPHKYLTTCLDILDMATPDGSTCLLLSLPAELRNVVYEYVLTFENELSIRITSRKIPKLYNFALSDVVALDNEANQMRYTCQQLHQETNGLSLRTMICS